MSSATLIAFERAARALGRTAGAYRAAQTSLPGIYFTLTMEALATVAIADGEASWSKLRHCLASTQPTTTSARPELRTAAVLHRMIGLSGSPGRGADTESKLAFKAALRWWPSALDSGGSMPERFARDLAHDLHAWATDGQQPALVKAAIATMCIAAAKPDCPDTGIVARHAFAFVLEAADPSLKWTSPPLSSWFYHDPSSWKVAASALANEGEPDPGKVDLGLRAIFDAVTRSATANALHVEWAGSEAVWLIDHSDAKFTRRQRLLVEVLVGLPALSPAHVPLLLNVTDRGARRIIRTVTDSGLVVERRNRRGEPYLMAPGGTRAWLTSVPHYQAPEWVDANV